MISRFSFSELFLSLLSCSQVDYVSQKAEAYELEVCCCPNWHCTRILGPLVQVNYELTNYALLFQVRLTLSSVLLEYADMFEQSEGWPLNPLHEGFILSNVDPC